MKVTKNGKELEKEKYSLEHKEIFRSDEDGLNIDCGHNCKIDSFGDDCEIHCGYNCKIDCYADNCKIDCEDDCEIHCGYDCEIHCGYNCRIDCSGDNCEITALKGTEIKYYYMGNHLTYKFKESKTILCKDGEFIEQ